MSEEQKKEFWIRTKSSEYATRVEAYEEDFSKKGLIKLMRINKEGVKSLFMVSDDDIVSVNEVTEDSE